VFLKQAEAMDLNPFTKEIYGVKVGGRLVLMTSIEGRRKIAHKSGNYLGCKVVVQYQSDNKTPYSATATAKKLVQGHVAEFEATVLFDEFDQGAGNWAKMPATMISKVAESTVLRMAFPQTDNVYDEAERAAIETAQDQVPLDDMPTPEKETQEVVLQDPGDFMVKFGSRKGNPTKLKDIPEQELTEFLAWAYAQEKLAPPIKEYVAAAEAFLGPKD
jgi:hypothetical protein